MTANPVDVLMGRLSRGDRSAFQPLFKALWPVVLRFCESLLGRHSDAQDAAQESMLKILERASSYQIDQPAMPWALAIAGWECRTVRRREWRRREVSEDEQSERTSSGDADVHEQREVLRAAMAALGALSEADRQVLLESFERSENRLVGEAKLPAERQRKLRAMEKLKAVLRRVYGIDRS